MNKNIFSLRLKNLLKESSVSQQKLANAIGTSRPAVTQFCTGSNLPSVETLYTIADYFDVSIDYLVGRSDSPKRH